ncbi:Malonyl CoA-acyl carrier protein transacylase [bacterium HR26]|nr:Malonyl CoA-acyl carrier protein transacylase [bacterium HR26]
MGAVAWVFPGQGSQKVGMGRELARREPIARRTFETADEVLGFPLSQLIFEGPEDELAATRNQQPAILATSIAYWRVLTRHGLLPPPDCLAGHSLGEYTALVAAGSLDFADAVRLVRRRGELMEEHGLGGMLAVIGLDLEALASIAKEAGVEVANINAPGQMTLSGRSGPLERAAELARQRGARRVVRLPVNAAFHSSLMRPVAEALRPLVESIPVTPPIAPLLANVDARPLSEPGELRQELLAQIAAPVRWVDVIKTAAARGVDHYYEVGPGRVLSGLIARIEPGAAVEAAEDLLTRVEVSTEPHG